MSTTGNIHHLVIKEHRENMHQVWQITWKLTFILQILNFDKSIESYWAVPPYSLESMTGMKPINEGSARHQKKEYKAALINTSI